MAQTGYTPILIYSSTTASQAPSASNLTNSTLGSELAINITDGKLFYKDNGGSVQVIAWKVTPISAGGTGLTSYTAGDTLYYATGTTLSKLAIGASKTIMTSSGTAPQWSASLDTSQGGTGNTSYTAGDMNYYASGTAFTKLAIGTAYQALQVNAGGTAPSWQPSATSVLTTQGDLLYASAANTLARLAKNTSATRYLSNSGTSNNPAWAQVDLTNGVTGTLPVGNGGTGQTSWTANGILYASGTTTLATSTNWKYDGTDVTLTSGNIVQGTAAKGINFTANSAAAGMTSQLLNWYEEGTWTPNQGSGLTVVGAFSSSGKYTRIGRQVTVQGSVAGATSIAIAATASQICSNLPYSSSPAYSGSMFNDAVAGFGGVASSGTIVYATSTMGATTNITFSVTYTV